ncbi:MAG: AAA family ATPase, partial [Anaerolineae bacterium]|nr:AAA family ATPase [Anaerolineae bacterium]
VQGLPHGEEVALSLTVLARLAAVEDIASVAKAQRGMGWLDRLAETPLRPQILEALRGLGDVSAEVALFRQATNPATQAAALNRAVGMLNEMAEYVEEIILPEWTLLWLAVQRWQSLVAEAAGRLGERTLREMAPSARRALSGGERRAALWSRPAVPFPNPYQTGDPVVQPLFVGRGDIFSRIREIWVSKAAPDSIILYGHRRMGKSSILRNLGEIAPAGSLLVREDLKGETAFAEGLHSLLLGLADAVAWMAQERGLDVPEPSPGDYATSDAAAHAFRRLLRRVLAALPEEASLILALDEFEAVDDAVRKGKIELEIYDYLRALSQQPRIVLVFAGLHTLDEMSRDYRAAFFGAYVNIRVSYLAPEAAERLIARPTPDFLLNYDPAVVTQIIHETHGQPLLLQRICQELVNHVNHELFDLEMEREARVLLEDLEAVLSDDFVRGETRYFDGIWQDQIAGRAAEEATLQALSSGPATASDLIRTTGLAEEAVAEALDYLKKRDLVARDADSWDILVPLMRRWLRLQEENETSEV